MKREEFEALRREQRSRKIRRFLGYLWFIDGLVIIFMTLATQTLNPLGIFSLLSFGIGWLYLTPTFFAGLMGIQVILIRTLFILFMINLMSSDKAYNATFQQFALAGIWTLVLACMTFWVSAVSQGRSKKPAKHAAETQDSEHGWSDVWTSSQTPPDGDS